MFGLSTKELAEISKIDTKKLKQVNLKNWDVYNKNNKLELAAFSKALEYVARFISDKNPYSCFVKYTDKDKCVLANGYDKQVTIWDLYDDLLNFINKTKNLLTIQGFKRDETEFKDSLSKFEGALKAVKTNNTQYEKESKILLDYVVKIYKKVVDKLKVDFNVK